jgi:RHS repeat-associated protein
VPQPPATLHAMLLRRLISLVAALVLACASTQTHAYARALQPESALPARAMVAPSPRQEIAAVTPSRTKEICPPLRECASTLGVTGYQKDTATGLYYAGARFYDPLVGGFNGMDPWAGDNRSPITLNKYLYGRSNPLIYIDPDGKVSFLSSLQEYLGGTLQSYETQREQAIADGNGALSFGLGVGKALASAGEMVISGLNTTSNLIAQHHYDGDVYEQTQRELIANETGMGQIIEGGHILGEKAYNDPVGTAKQVRNAAVDFADRLADRDPRALGTAGEIVGGLLIPAGGGAKKVLDEGIDAARIAARLDFDVSDIVRDLDEGFRPANAAHGVRAVEKPGRGVGVVENKTPICGSGGPCSVYEIPESELIADLPYIGKTRRNVDKRMADKDHRKKTPTGQPPKAETLAENLTPDEAAGLEALRAHERGLGNLSNAIPPLNLNLPKNAGRLEAARKLLEKARGGGGSQ